MFYKNGTLAEDRFKNLTPLQWLFHYLEIVRFKNKEIELKDKILELLLNRIEILWLTTNPTIGKKLIEFKEQNKTSRSETKNNTDDINADNFKEKWSKIKKMFPAELDFYEVFPEKRFVLPTFKRDKLRKALGIHVDNN